MLQAKMPVQWWLHWCLRIAVAMEFIGHGAFGVLTKKAWLPYIQLWGFSESTAWKLMPLVGLIDIGLGVSTLFVARRSVFAYMAFWGFFTACLRPLSGESAFEFIERSYNFCMPFAFLLLHGFGSDWGSWFRAVRFSEIKNQQDPLLLYFLRGIVFWMLIGHGVLGAFIDKPSLQQHYSAVGLDQITGMSLTSLNLWIGTLEMALAVSALWIRSSGFFLFICLWKMTSELLFVPAKFYGAGWEFIERGGAYFAPLLLFILIMNAENSEQSEKVPAFSR